MTKYSGNSKLLMWTTALAFAGAMAGCGGGGGGNGAAPATGTGPILTVAAGAGTGVGGAGVGPAPVNLLSIATNNFAILTKTGITNTGSHGSAITGNIGASPITAASMDGVFCSEITGTIYGVDAAYVGSGAATCFAGSSADKTLVDNAVADMGTAYAAATVPAPDYTELGAGNIGGMTLPPAVYKWGTGLLIPTDLVLSGGPNDVWIFQVAGNLTIANAARITLAGGALAQNIFWQVAGGTGVAIGTTAHFEGTLLAAKAITVMTGASANGRFLSQTAVTLDANAIVKQ